ncbi:MAG: undecaprenyl-phosphate alpha-N-acetylglucosaminyl 1-phosphate transferase [Candidatus Omnitrophica bacterium CG11_big_fil_rev_8_21_14_0_20_42_13]|uniref:Undecaprenyl-phosphate alpha-N-acetylglucosaminyl 1-phosphate transferase n=1 Tax=Candidatus Ghiorseimicrobium undicola TaxID=1974746 RepID=A0A2H0LYG5_9BACT|nr:MAG: undecaprenyl-phosphate alpha-N-acetylglucosaminyl 1-phosphate transferase [Candidatus Omnitrophica bacterium CG11_big_fil_rev_8_21_14_0_20_42_13]
MYIKYLSAFLTAFAISLLITPIIKRVAIAKKWLDKPNWRKINKKPMPLLGGIAIYCGSISSLLLFAKAELSAEKFTGLIGGSLIIFLAGIADDIKGITARRKLFYQMVAALIAYISGFSIIHATNLFGITVYLPAIAGLLLTLFWIIGLTNAINLLDGLDGLAAGTSAIIAGTLFFAGIRSDNITLSILSIAIAGGALGFLPYNFYPAKIFMGDTGSMFLGFMLSLISMEGAYKGATFVALIAPIIAMGIPVIDTFLAIVRRLTKGDKVFFADKEHIHHKLVISEGSQKKAVLMLYSITIYLGFISVSLMRMQGVWAFAATVITIILIMRWMISFELITVKNKNGSDGGDNGKKK